MESDVAAAFLVGLGVGIFITGWLLCAAFNRDKAEVTAHCNDLRAKVRELTEDRYRLERQRDFLQRELGDADYRLAKIGEYVSGLESKRITSTAQ